MKKKFVGIGLILMVVFALFCFITASRQYSYKEGYDVGAVKGFKAGYCTGENEGYKKGFTDGEIVGHDRIINMTTVSENCTPQEAIERLARSRESHRKGSESSNLTEAQFDIDCMQSYTRIANLIKRMAQQIELLQQKLAEVEVD